MLTECRPAAASMAGVGGRCYWRNYSKCARNPTIFRTIAIKRSLRQWPAWNMNVKQTTSREPGNRPIPIDCLFVLLLLLLSPLLSPLLLPLLLLLHYKVALYFSILVPSSLCTVRTQLRRSRPRWLISASITAWNDPSERMSVVLLPLAAELVFSLVRFHYLCGS